MNVASQRCRIFHRLFTIHLQKALEECKMYIIEGNGLSLLNAGKESVQPLVAGRTFHGMGKLVVSLCHALLQCHGVDPQGHDFMKREDARLRVYEKKIDKAVARYKAHKEKESKMLTMDVDTANKFISAALLSDEDAKGTTLHCTYKDKSKVCSRNKPSKRRKRG